MQSGVHNLLRYVSIGFHQTYLIETKSYGNCRCDCNLDYAVLSRARGYRLNKPAMIPIQNKDMLILLAWRSWAQVTGRDVIVCDCGACTVGCAKCCDTSLGCGSILTAERVGISHEHKALVQPAAHETWRNFQHHMVIEEL